jgi:hypothetical protein
MKLFLLLYTVCFLSIANAQNWKPLCSNYKYNYIINDSKAYRTIWADSSKLIGNDSVFFLKRIVKELQFSFPKRFYLKNQPDYLLSKITISTNWIDFYKKSATNYRIYTNDTLQATHIINNAMRDTVMFAGATVNTLFNTTDSIKYFVINNIDTITLSKNFGIIRFPLFDSSHHYIYLVGIEGKNVGVQMPKFKDYYNYNIGDVFYFQKGTSTQSSSRYEDWKLKITHKKNSGDTIFYTYNLDVKETIPASPHIAIPETYNYYHSENNQLTYTDSINHILNIYRWSNKLMKNRIITMTNDNNLCEIIRRRYTSTDINALQGDTIFDSFGPPPFSYDYKIYGTFCGEIDNGSSTIFGGGGNNYSSISSSSKLIGYVKQGIACGTILSDSSFINPNSIKNINSAITNINSYPNPFSNTLTIAYELNKSASLKLYVTNLYGVTIAELLNANLPQGKHSLHYTMPTHVASGLYILNFTDDAGNVIRRKINYIKQ